MCLNKFLKIIICSIILTITTSHTLIGASTNKLSPPSTQEKYNPNIIVAKGKLEGSMTQYILGLPFTGNVSLHYSAINTGFIIGNTTILTIKLPVEFENVAATSTFREKITGTLHLQTILGQKNIPITPEMVDSYPDRIIIQAPPAFWSGVGQFSADLTINYGEFLEQYPQINIPDAPNGYKFITQLQYSPTLWDFIQTPIIGTSQDTYISKETSASIQ